MKKIKHFKINIRPREVIRLLKTTANLTEITPQIEEAVGRESKRIDAAIRTAAVYETFPKEKLPAELHDQAESPWIAASLFLVTVGDEVEREVTDASRHGEELVHKILHAVALEAIHQSVNFVYRLLADEAKDENCELSRQSLVKSAEGWGRLFDLLPGDKIGIRFREAGVFEPMYSSGGIFYWTPVKKRSRK